MRKKQNNKNNGINKKKTKEKGAGLDDKQIKERMVDLNTTVSIVISNVNVLTIPIKRQFFSD